MKLSNLFDGDTHELTPGEEFSATAHMGLVGFSPSDEDEELGALESPRLVPEFSDLSGSPLAVQLPEYAAQTGWGAFALAMNALCSCLGVDKHQYQHNIYTPDGKKLLRIEFSFMAKLSDEGWPGGRL